jgi:hypothetical protein
MFCRGCGYSQRIWQPVMKKCIQDNIPIEWEDIKSKGVKEWRGKNLKAVICKLAWGSVVYHLWRQRNDVKFGNSLISDTKDLLGGKSYN